MDPAPRLPKADIPFRTESEIGDFVAQLEQCTWPYERWTHRAHLALAAAYLRRFPFDEALARVRACIRRYNESRGDLTGYHETITVFFVRQVAAAALSGDLAATVERLASTCTMATLEEYFSPERIWSDKARREWVEPDRKALG